jgi:DNA-binding response OmpR family regulator
MYTVLVVDDDVAIREIFTAFLKRGGIEAIAVSGGRECLDLLRTRTPDLILLDLMMTPMDGWETLRAIRRLNLTGQFPVMIVTGKQPVPDDILQYGCLIEDFIGKPIEFDKLVARMPHIIERIRDLYTIAAQKTGAGEDPELVDEYIRLLRLVRITYKMIRRYQDIPWADRISLKKQEERLALLHTLLGFPDYFLDWKGGKNESRVDDHGIHRNSYQDDGRNDYIRGT